MHPLTVDDIICALEESLPSVFTRSTTPKLIGYIIGKGTLENLGIKEGPPPSQASVTQSIQRKPFCSGYGRILKSGE